MPRIHNLTIPVFLDPIPISIPRPVEILRRPGMAGASVLFHARQFEPLIIRTVSSAPDKLSAFALAQKYLRMIRLRVKIDDGVTSAEQSVVLAVSSTCTDSGMVIGGNGASDKWSVNSAWTFLLDADQDRA